MKVLVSSCLAVLALLRPTLSYPNGAGRCAVGEAAPKGFHADPAPGTSGSPGMSGSLSAGSFVLEVNGNQVTPSDGTIFVPPDTDFDITLSGGDFRGFLIMLGGQAEGALVGDGPEAQQAVGTDCGGTASITHTSNDVKQSVTVTGNLPAGTATTIEVNVVVQNSGGVSTYNYDQFALEAGVPMTLPTETGSPTGSPVAATQVPASSPATESPVGSPVEGNATSIADLVMATPELSDLASFLTTDLIAALSGDGPFTVFAPTNDAFDKIPEDVIAALAADEATLVDVLTYHVLDSIVFSTDLVEGAVITALNGDNLTVTSLDPVTINDSVVITADIEADNGVVHLIDTVLIPPADETATAAPTGSPVTATQVPTASSPATESPVGSPVEGNATSVGELIMTTPELSDLATAFTTDLIATLYGDGPFTVFAPTNDAFDKLPEDVIATWAADEATLVDVLTYHVLDSIVFSSDLVEGAVITALNGDNLTVTSLDPVTINDSVVITADIEADNGVVHLIDTILIPPEDETATEAPTAAPTGSLVVDTLPPTGSFTSPPTASPGDIVTPAPANETILPSTVAPANGTIVPSTFAPSTAVPANETDAPATVTPSPVPIADLVVADPELSTLAGLLTDDLIAALSGNGPFTVFAPVNDAFDSLPADVLSALLADEEALVDVLTYHVVGSVLSSTDLRVVPVTTALNGDVLTVTSTDPLILNGAATVIAADIEATNGVVHLIDAVLIPPEDQVPNVDQPCADCPPLVIKGNNRRPSESWPLGLCEGDCDIDSDCAGDLVCFKTEDVDTVPGCSGTRPTRPRDDNKVDYCYNPNR